MQSSIWLARKYVSWLKKSEGITLRDKILIFLVKLVYLTLRLSFLVLGKKRSNKLLAEKGLDFGSLWNKSFKFARKDDKNSELLKFKMPRYNYEFYCRNNKDDFQIMTFHEHDIIANYFSPKEGDLVIDVGAHIGPYTLVASKLVGENGKVVAIEADPCNFDILVRNIHLNRVRNVITLNYAVYSKEGKLNLYLPTKNEETSLTKFNTVMLDRAHGETNFLEVDGRTLDYLLESNGLKHEDVNWIKIDVEGAEYDVLKGAKNILSKSSKISLLIEIHNLAQNCSYYEPIKEFLNSYNFKIEFEILYKNGERHLVARKY